MSHKLDFSRSRKRMVDEQIASRGIENVRLLDALNNIPRHLFVEEALQDQAYNDYPLPIGEKQTISQPYMVALMTEALELRGGERVLEIGTGSGYQAAILAELAEWVYSIERIRSLANRARKILCELNYYNIEIRVSDGTRGWKEKAPFQAITVTAGAPEVPQPLVDQLAVGGRLVVPIGDVFSQTLIRVIRTEEGIEREDLGGCHFVRLIGKYGWQGE
ncbi:MAG: protein-L-isoaspartate(D-aspartate) O-methyltransferase [Syntrophobacterales bacterium]|nr:MAG: protein-L-isoaspartate(D-aspartate) O-methyltransferase [Syntrophobacterales bacterium]